MRDEDCIIFLSLHDLCAQVEASFNYTSCPAAWELQSDFVKKSFNLTKFQGTYYELALHDYTQYPVCPSPKCVRSHKVADFRLKQVNDTFDLDCFGHIYPSHFRFNLTSTPGHFLGTSTFIPDVVFPDTVVDMYENPNGVYEWVIEFQCVEKLGHVWFVGINWYCRENQVSDDYYQSLIKAAQSRGLDFYMDKGVGVYKVDQDNCTYSG